MSSTLDILKHFGERVTKLARINVGATRTIDGKRRRMDSSGDLRRSIDYGIEKGKNSFTFWIEMEDYGVFQDQGVKGSESTPSSASKSPFKYTSGSKIPFPYVKAWIKQKPVRLRDLETGSFIKETPSRINGLAYVIAKSIKEHGISATNFLTDPFIEEFKKLPDEFVEAFGLDVDEFLEHALDQLKQNNDGN